MGYICVICDVNEVPEARVEFLKSEGRPPICISCQEKLEEAGEYELYIGVYNGEQLSITKGKPGEDDYEEITKIISSR